MSSRPSRILTRLPSAEIRYSSSLSWMPVEVIPAKAFSAAPNRRPKVRHSQRGWIALTRRPAARGRHTRDGPSRRLAGKFGLRDRACIDDALTPEELADLGYHDDRRRDQDADGPSLDGDLDGIEQPLQGAEVVARKTDSSDAAEAFRSAVFSRSSLLKIVRFSSAVSSEKNRWNSENVTSAIVWATDSS